MEIKEEGHDPAFGKAPFLFWCALICWNVKKKNPRPYPLELKEPLRGASRKE
jgi:hypothetical protein